MADTPMEKPKGPRVIGAGMPRTGTASLQEALKILGFAPCHHMVSDVLGDVNGRGKHWSKAWNTANKAERQALIRPILAEYRAVVDFPASILIDDMVEIYPDAKVVLGIRSTPEAWRKSFSKTLDLTATPWWVACTCLLPQSRFLFWDAVPWWEKVSKERYGGGAQIYRTSSTDAYTRHNEYVRKLVPRDRLLEFGSEQGWEPLCKFLGVPVPDRPFPHINDGEKLRRMFLLGAVLGAAIWLVLIGSCVGVLYFSRRALFGSERMGGAEL